MGNGFADTPLAVFTTLAPMAAVSFLVVSYLFFALKPDKDTAARIDKATLIPLVVLLVGFLGAFMHLANPLNAWAVLSGIGSSPLSNEVFAGALFMLIALAYVIWALTGKLPPMVRRLLLVVLSVLGIVFAVLCGMAYMLVTVPTWNTPLSIVQMLGYALTGGVVLGFTVAGVARVEVSRKTPLVAALLVCGGGLIGALGFGLQIAGLAAMRNIWGTADLLVPAIWGLFVAFVICAILGAVLTFLAGRKSFSPTVMAMACVVVAVGIFLARIGFYGLFMGVAL